MGHLSGETDAPPVALTLQVGTDDALWPGVLALRRRVFGEEQAIVDFDAPDPDDEIGIHVIATVREPGDTPALSWIAPSIARIAFNGERAVYKLYAIIDQTNLTGSVSMATGSDFVAEVLAAFDAQLLAAQRGSTGETAAKDTGPSSRGG